MNIENPTYSKKETVYKECNRCNRTGVIRTDLPGFSEVTIPCPSCEGKGYQRIIQVEDRKEEDIEDYYLG